MRMVKVRMAGRQWLSPTWKPRGRNAGASVICQGLKTMFMGLNNSIQLRVEATRVDGWCVSDLLERPAHGLSERGEQASSWMSSVQACWVEGPNRSVLCVLYLTKAKDSHKTYTSSHKLSHAHTHTYTHTHDTHLQHTHMTHTHKHTRTHASTHKPADSPETRTSTCKVPVQRRDFACRA